ncbi:MAG TPA: class I SAM-dependent methyltransferase, partial [Gemmata sp.]|nr:class I SAM-dependent methyltransferase [Gemmata sp.]
MSKDAVADGSTPAAEADDAARGLLARIEFLLAKLEHGPATVVGRRIAIVSRNAGDAHLARLLRAFGGEPAFICPDSEESDQPGIMHSLSRLLREKGDAVDVPGFVAAEGAAARHSWPPATEAAAEFDLVFALGVLPTEPAEAITTLAALGKLVKVGGDLEIQDSADAPLPEATRQAIADEAGHRCLGVRSSHSQPWHLSLVRLAEPLAEHPVEVSADGVILAHCLSRLHFAREFVSGRDVLEAGCATGIGARLFAQAGARMVLGVELQPELLERARALTSDP